MAEKNCFDMTKLIFQIMYVTVVQWSRSCWHVQTDKPGSTPGDAVFCFLVLPFFFSVWSLFFNTIFQYLHFLGTKD